MIYMEMTAGQITDQAINMLGWLGFEAEKHMNIPFRRRKNMVKKGKADITGYERATGKHMECEVKTINDVLSPDQKSRLTKMHLHNCHALIATEVNGLVKIIPYIEYSKPKNDVNKL
jgi:hypothetical protein